MKKILVSVITLVGLAGCSGYYDYYRAGVQYTQDGDDCIYYMGESGQRFSSDIRSLDATQKIVYRNTRCSDLYARDNANMIQRNERYVIVPASNYSVAAPVKSCGCKSCGRGKYVLVSD